MTSGNIDDIWDLPAETSLRASTSAAPPVPNASDSEKNNTGASGSHQAKRTLFLPSDGEDDQGRPSLPKPTSGSRNIDIDALFEDLDDIQDLAPTFDLDKFRREADARHAKAARAKFALDISSQTPANATGGSGIKGKNGAEDGDGNADEDREGEEGKRKKKKARAKLDETRLLGDEFGFPRLIKETKNFKPLGKGHETKDLDRVIEIYRFWAHRMWPKDRFVDTAQRVERLCHSRRMHVALSVWQDEAKGLVNGRKLPDEDVDIDFTGDPEDQLNGRVSSSSSRATSPASNRAHESRNIDEDNDGALFGPGSRAPTLPPSTPDVSSGHEDNLDDMDLDTVLADEARTAADADRFFEKSIPGPVAFATAPNELDDDAMWDMFDTIEVPLPPPQEKSALREEMDGDDDTTRDAMREAGLGALTSAPAANKPPSVRTVEARRRAEEEEWESMYA
ncbi:replication fork protection component Swi3-domain-containing protein [Vararia minispora EC-137]|uniref:Replication fork protection component Swi3-domain-containing protein n=1 Tax=Vararia minispora EC-137 TaxID=1314806 RepID=A0ACB8QTT8_9AGAM|nr:replication fork protection component Swi3-domain-containing protein [Vararia minispora EC-137]